MDKSRPVLFYPAVLDDLTKLTITPEYTSEQVPEIINQDEGVRSNPGVANRWDHYRPSGYAEAKEHAAESGIRATGDS